MNTIILELYAILIMLILTLFILLPIKYYSFRKEHFSQGNNICCLYAYYEKDDLYKKNFEYFLENGILDNVDYYIIINGLCTVDIPKKENIQIYNRENKGYDFGAYSYGIKKLNKEYNYYFFLNTSVEGPYLKDNNKPWTEYFLQLFNKDVKLVGTSINIYSNNIYSGHDLTKIYNKEAPFTHVQSMFFCIDNEYFNYLKKINFFNEEDLNDVTEINYIIAYKEFGLSQHAVKNNWNINSILSKYQNLDYRTLKEDINSTSIGGDPYYPSAYFGETIDKYDAIFYKNNRF